MEGSNCCIMYALLNERLKLVVMVALLPWVPVKTVQVFNKQSISLLSIMFNIHDMSVVVLVFCQVREVQETLEIPVKFTIPAIPLR